MDDVTNSVNEFEFIDADVADIDVGVEDVDFEDSAYFEDASQDIADKTEVIICTKTFRIYGKISLVPGARLTDYIVEANQFIAVTDVEMKDAQGNLILHTPFLDINRDHIVVILPADFAKVADARR
ncbi:MAG: hypothetical protein GY801_39870 [bacterium]|nr:hypothetical protein [bacterium]